MRTNEDFARFLLSENPKNSAARLSLYQYLKNFTKLNSQFSPQTIQNFYRRALSSPQWQQNKKELTDFVIIQLESFLGRINNNSIWAKIKHPDEMQVIELEHTHDLLEVLNNYLIRKKTQKNHAVVADQKTGAHIIGALDNGKFIIQSFNNLAIVTDGRLEPLCFDRVLYYDASLNLQKNVIQQAQITPNTVARFCVQTNQIKGWYYKGYTFTKTKTIAALKLEDEPKLLYALKNLERYFVDQHSDPVYRNLVANLESGLYSLESRQKKAHHVGLRAYEMGENALMNLFPDDKLIQSLVNDLRAQLITKGILRWQNPSELINSSLSADTLLEEKLTSL